MTESTGSWRCVVCGYVHRGPEPPDVCPVCGAPKSAFEAHEEPEAKSATAKPAAAKVAGPKRWRCMVCGYVHEGDAPPLNCPACGAGADCFELVEEEGEAGAQGENAGKVIVVGAGIAGISAIEALLEAAPETEVTLFSREPELPYHRLNLTRLLAGKIKAEDLPLHPRSWYDERGVHLRLGMEITAIDTQKQTVERADGETESFDTLILTAGSHAFVPPIMGAQRDGVLAFRTIEDTQRIIDAAKAGAKCVCIGGGLLGLEAAGGMAHQGGDVTVIEGAPWLMPRQLSEPGGRMLQQYVERIGVKVVTGARIAEFVGDERVRGVLLEDDSVIEADLVVLSTGVRPNSYLARLAGLEVNRGVVVNNFLETSQPNIYAAGDVTEHHGVVYGIWPAAQYQGKIAGMNAAGVRTEFAGIPPSSTLKVLDIDVVSIGKVEPEDGSWQVVEDDADGKYVRFLFRDTHLSGAVMVGDTSSAVGAREAVEQKSDFSAVLHKGVTADDIKAALAGE